MNSNQLALRAGISYRQLDYWTLRGWAGPGLAGLGSGNQREWPADAVAHVVLMARLVRAGLATVPAHDAACQIEQTGQATLREGFVICEQSSVRSERSGSNSTGADQTDIATSRA